MQIGEAERWKFFQEKNKDPDSNNGNYWWRLRPHLRWESDSRSQFLPPINDCNCGAEMEVFRAEIVRFPEFYDARS